MRQLAPVVGVEFSALAKWEQGTNDVPLSRLKAWANALGVSLTVIATDARTVSLDDPDLSSDQRALLGSMIELLPKLGDAEARMLRGQIEGLARMRGG